MLTLTKNGPQTTCPRTNGRYRTVVIHPKGLKGDEARGFSDLISPSLNVSPGDLVVAKAFEVIDIPLRAFELLVAAKGTPGLLGLNWDERSAVWSSTNSYVKWLQGLNYLEILRTNYPVLGELTDKEKTYLNGIKWLSITIENGFLLRHISLDEMRCLLQDCMFKDEEGFLVPDGEWESLAFQVDGETEAPPNIENLGKLEYQITFLTEEDRALMDLARKSHHR